MIHMIRSNVVAILITPPPCIGLRSVGVVASIIIGCQVGASEFRSFRESLNFYITLVQH